MKRVLRNKDKELKIIEDSVDIGDMLAKLDEIVDWINQQEVSFDISVKNEK